MDLQLSGFTDYLCGGFAVVVFATSRPSCQHIDQLLWKAEVDLENVEDMYLRLGRVPQRGLNSEQRVLSRTNIFLEDMVGNVSDAGPCLSFFDSLNSKNRLEAYALEP